MESWQGATASDRRIFTAVSLVFLNHPNLLDFFFEKDRARIRIRGIEMRRAARGFSHGEQMLIRVALDIWSGSGNAKVWQMLETLDQDNLRNSLKALAYIRGIEIDN